MESKYKSITRLILSFFLIFLFIPVINNTIASEWCWPAEFQYKIVAYNTYIQFQYSIYFDALGYDDMPNNHYVFFCNLTMDGETFDGWWWITSQNANVTVNSFFADRILKLTMTGNTGDSYTVNFTAPPSETIVLAKLNGQVVTEGWSIQDGVITVQGTFHSSDVWEFIWDTPPNTPSLTDPPENELCTPSSTITFTWVFSDNDTDDYQAAYQFQLDDDSDFSSPAVDTGWVESSTSSHTQELPASAGIYYWRVRVKDAYGLASDWNSSTIRIAYWYDLNGPYYENGTIANVSIPATAYFTNTMDQFELNGTTIRVVYFEKPILFTFDLGGAERQWYMKDSYENITLFIPYDACKIYEFTIQDYAGILSGETFLQAESYINETFDIQPITRVSTTATVGPAKLLLQIGRTYMLKLVGPDFEYVFGLFTADGTGETLTVTPISFPERVKLAYRYVLVDASRPDNNTIIVNYQDTTEKTISTQLYIQLKNGTIVYEGNSTADVVQYSWSNAVGNTSYYVVLTINHEEFGTMTFRKALPPLVTGASPFRLDFLGTIPVPGDQIVALFLILIVAALFSTLNAAFGIVIVCLFAGFLWAAGWLDVTGTTIAICLSLAVLYALGRRRNE